jgi:NAD(P)-dependent dehydrogenase (short-subunit alcohol dehydrogenase family)
MAIKGKVVAITGASSGIGRATARLLAERGAMVALGARREARGARRRDALAAVADEIAAAGGNVTYRVTDVPRPADLEALVALAIESGGIYLYPSRGSLRFRRGNTTTERKIFQTCGRGEMDEDIVTRNSRRGSKFVRKTRQ